MLFSFFRTIKNNAMSFYTTFTDYLFYKACYYFELGYNEYKFFLALHFFFTRNNTSTYSKEKQIFIERQRDNCNFFLKGSPIVLQLFRSKILESTSIFYKFFLKYLQISKFNLSNYKKQL